MDSLSEELQDIKLWLRDSPELEKIQCSPVNTQPSDGGVTLVTYGRDTPDHHGYTELSSIIAGDPALLDGVHVSVGVIQGVINDKESTEMLHIFKHTNMAVVSLANAALAAADKDREGGIETMIKYLRQSVQHVKWVGLGMQSYMISNINGMKVGFTAVCISHAQCSQDHALIQYPNLAPVKYQADLFTIIVNKLHELGAQSIVVLAYWGRQRAVIPEDHTVLVAKQMSNIGANVIIGNHPRVVQDHAYMGNTLVIFSQGNVAISKDDLCWTEEGLFREDSHGCNSVHPQLRDKLKNDERRMRLYRIMLSSNGLVHADYRTFELEESAWRPSYLTVSQFNRHQWTRACSSNDPHCLMCDYF